MSDKSNSAVKSKVKSKLAIKPKTNTHSKHNDLSYLSEDIISNIDVGIYIVQQGKLVYVSSLYKKLTGYSDKELLNQNPLDYLHPDDRDVTRKNAIKVLKQESSDPYEYRFIKKTGEVMWVLERITSITYKGKRAALGSLMDITARKLIETSLLKSEEKYRTILENIEDGYAEHDLKGNFIFFNEALCKIEGYTRDELMGMNYRELMDEENAKKICQKYNKVYTTGESEKEVQYEIIAKGGTRKYLETSITPMKDAAGRVTAFRGIMRDRTERNRAIEVLRGSEARYRSIIDTIQDGYFEIDLNGKYTFVNDIICQHLQYSREELIGMDNRTYQTPQNAKKAFLAFFEVYTTGKPIKAFEMEIIRKDGTTGVSEVSISIIKDDQGLPTGFRGISRDISERKKMEEALRYSEERHRSILENMQEAYYELDLEGCFLFVNDALCGHLGYTREELIGTKNSLHQDKENNKKMFQVFSELYRTGKPIKAFEVEFIRKDKTRGTYELSVDLIRDSQGTPTGFRGVSRDITERKQAEEQIQYLATHDGLTGLANRTLFSQLLNHAIQSARRYKRIFAVFFIDLDRFKIINDTLGHDAGDQLLQEVSIRFKQTLRASDTVARLGGDEFVILIEEISDLNYVAVVAHKILAAAIKPMMLMGEECRVTASIGISTYPKDGKDEQSLLKNADIAMYFAKEEGKNNFQLYSKDIKAHSTERLAIETHLRFALERNEFSLHYQAKLDFKTGAIKGVEALLRWDNPHIGSITPTQFIPVAEETGMIVPIGRWVLKTACAQNVAWQRQGLPSICMAVNLSMRQLMDDNLIADIQKALKDSGMEPNLLELEITESMVMHNPVRIIAVLARIKNLGVRLALDDFGTGYSSLAQLKNFPIDTLKIDRSFVRDIMQNSEDKAIAEAIIAMGKTLSLTVIAEGVETQEQKNFMQEHECDEMQGFHFSKPIAPDKFADLLRKHLPYPQKGD